MAQEERALVPAPTGGGKLNKSSQALAIRRAQATTGDYVFHLNIDQVKTLAGAAAASRHGERDRLLIQTLFDGCLRCSEAIGLRPNDILREDDGWSVRILGKGGAVSKAAISSSLAAQLQSFAYRHQLPETSRLFPITRSQAFHVVANAFDAAGIPRPRREVDRVGAVHILRHSGAIERLKRTGNPKAVQDQLRHKSAMMTLRYMKTISHEESLVIQQGVDFQW